MIICGKWQKETGIPKKDGMHFLTRYAINIYTDTDIGSRDYLYFNIESRCI